MCYWGEVLAPGTNINLPMPDDAVAPAHAARASAVEQALIKAQAARYQHPAPPRRDVAKAFPNDDNVQVLYAESLMDLSP